MKYVLITGASTGIGFALAQEFVNCGYFIFGSVRKLEDADKLSALGENVQPLLFDVTDTHAVREAVRKIKNTVGDQGLAGLINNAGIAITGTVMHTSLQAYQKQFDVNLFGLIDVTQACLEILGARTDCPHPPGKILNISSTAGEIGYPFLSPYCASKYAVEGFSHSLRRELLPYGVDVVIIGPGPIKTPIWGKSTEPTEEEARSIFGEAIRNFRNEFLKSEHRGMEVEDLAHSIRKVFEKKKPKPRYAFLKNMMEWIIPRYFMSHRMMDKVIVKMYKVGK